MAMRAGKRDLKVGGRTVTISNPDKVMYPGAGFTKAQVIDYYVRVSRWLLPHLRHRPVTLKRYPDGVTGEHFYEKDAPSFTPDWVRTFPVPRRGGGEPIRYILIDDLATLVWCANLANLEIHPFLHRAPEIDAPTFITFDLDPGEGADVLTCARVAFLLRDVLERLQLESFVKVSGSKGLQIYVPLNTSVTYAVTQPFARTLAGLLEREHPALIVSDMSKAVRKRKVFIDWSQNADHKTTIGVYSLRAKREYPFVSAPVTWEELRSALDHKDSGALYFNPEATLERMAESGDLFAAVLKLRQQLPPAFTDQVAPAAKKPSPRSLEKYGAKRDFAVTAEPAPAPPRRSRQGSRRRFVIQKHAASHLHYDFRLEMHDVLKSWAVPKGVPYTVDERRLAQETEDHPIEYLDFEGTIPKGQYGGGTVLVWDIGTWELIDGNYYKGRLHFHLAGRKLKGDWLLVKDKAHREDKRWYLIKAEASARPSAKRDDESALTGRTMQQIAEANDRQRQSNRDFPELDKLPQAEIRFVEPMLAKLTGSLPAGEQWQYEIKWDGYRTLALRDEKGVQLLSRRASHQNARFPSVADACTALEPGTIVDGEVIALDADGRPSFNVLQNARSPKVPLLYYAFDLIAWRGRDVSKLPLARRQEMLSAALANAGDPIRLSVALKAAPDDLIRAAREQGLEGIVAKRATSVYEPGQRSGAWQKVKVNQSHELVVGGYKPDAGEFDYLLAGYYEGDRLIFIAKIRNGFTPAMKRKVAARFKGLGTRDCPFANLPEAKTARRGEAITAEVMKKIRWLRPELVAQVEFTDWTAANHLRHARFSGLRDDKDPREVVKERRRGGEDD